jgi:hypothetical protein
MILKFYLSIAHYDYDFFVSIFLSADGQSKAARFIPGCLDAIGN